MKRTTRQVGPDRAIGIDLGRDALDVVTVSLDGRPRVLAAQVVDPAAPAALLEQCAGAGAIAIDAPAEPSTAPHAHDPELLVGAKFRSARCGEIALGQQHTIWVSWPTPPAAAATPAWMTTGFATWAALRRAGHSPIEVYPHGIFRVLAGCALPKKTTRAGRAARREVLAVHVELPDQAAGWSHDALDACAAALVAAWKHAGKDRAIAAGHDGDDCDSSTIWLPDPRQVRRTP